MYKFDWCNLSLYPTAKMKKKSETMFDIISKVGWKIDKSKPYIYSFGFAHNELTLTAEGYVKNVGNFVLPSLRPKLIDLQGNIVKLSIQVTSLNCEQPVVSKNIVLSAINPEHIDKLGNFEKIVAQLTFDDLCPE